MFPGRDKSCVSGTVPLKKGPMQPVSAIGFDLFNTLITVEPHGLDEALTRLTGSLRQSGLPVAHDAFRAAHRKAAVRYIEGTRRDGRETHNRFWISSALGELGYDLPPDDPRIATAIDAYFSAFVDLTHLIPGTAEVLGALMDRYRIGLLSNFTHGPAARRIIEKTGLGPFFSEVVISGEFGFRKPHPAVFREFLRRMGISAGETLYVGDNPESDIAGARGAGIQPVWTRYVRDRKIPFAPGIGSEQRETPGPGVPTISRWDDLVSLLETRFPPAG